MREPYRSFQTVQQSHPFFSGRRVVVSGGAGFIGNHFVEALISNGADVRVPVRRRRPIYGRDEIEIIEADLTCQEQCRRAVRGSELVVHAAGAVSAAGVTVGANPMSSITANLILTANILEACWAEGVARVLVFGSSTGYPDTDHAVREDEMWSGPTHPSYFGYGWMRRYIERMAEFVANKSGVKIALARPTATYGPHDDFNPQTSHVIPALIRRAVARENPFEVWGTGDEERDFLHVRDLVRGCLLLLERHAECDPVNIGFGQPTTIRKVVGTILEAAGHSECDVRFDATKPTTIPKRIVDCSKAKRLLQFEPEIRLEDGLRDTVHWYIERENARSKVGQTTAIV